MTIIYVVKNAQESLLGLRDGEALGIIQINPNGEIVRQATVNDPRIKEIVSGDETQEDIDKNMDNMVNGFKEVFKGIGRATKVPPIEIEVDSSIPPLQQMMRPIPIRYKEKLRLHLQELVKEGIVTPLTCTNGTGWIHSMVITAKKWNSDKI